MNYFTADPHFGHENVIKYCNRPFKNMPQMNKEIIENINQVVKDEDHLYILGDLSLAGPKRVSFFRETIGAMNGIKHLVLGESHDRLRPFNYVRYGIASVHTSLEFNMEGFMTTLTHDPAKPIIGEHEILICGHVHEFYKIIGRKHGVIGLRENSDRPYVRENIQLIINVGVDVWDFFPVSSRQLYDIIKKEKFDN